MHCHDSFAADRYGRRTDVHDAVARRRLCERDIDRWVHRIGLAAAPAAVIALAGIAQRRGAVALAGVLVYGTGLLAMIGCSALYHLCGDARRRALYRQLDHAAIFLMIAGTYTPLTLVAIGGSWGHGLLVFVWTVAACGIAVKLVRPGVLEKAAVGAYLLLGWSGLVALEPLLASMSGPALALLAAGGALYTVGVPFHAWRALPYHDAVWHAFVLAGAACHYAAIVTVLV